jgi:cellulose synthase/poly-beta-1,6-N-acetylglucosamine synthase-like glycosyltransferase
MANCHRTDVLAAMGGFPDDSVTEDFNLTWALHRRGYSVVFTPRRECGHLIWPRVGSLSA